LSQEYYRILARRISAEVLDFGVAQVIVIVLAIVTLALQIRYGLVHPGDFWPSVWATILPYVGLVFLFLLYQLIRVPKLLYQERDGVALTEVNTLKAAIAERERTISKLTPKRSAAEQHAHDIVAEALKVVKQDGITALRHLKYQGKFTDGTYRSQSPTGLTPDRTLWVYQHCSSVGIVSVSINPGNTERAFTLSSDPAMLKALDELLFSEK
jgi:hypothetical protein